MNDIAVQWIVVGAIVALCVWRIIESVRARRKSGGCSCGCGGSAGNSAKECRKPTGCDGCPLSGRCEK